MKKYEKPSLEITALDVLDIITASSAVNSVIDGSVQTVEQTVNFDKLNL